MDPTNPLRNPKDPLHHATQPGGRELFTQIAKVCSGFNNEQVMDAAINLLINAIRQTHPSWQKAEAAFNDKFGRGKSILRDQYDTISGRKKGVYPFDQVIQVGHIDFSKWKK